MKNLLLLLVGSLLLLSVSCHDEKTDVPIKKAIYTMVDKDSYHQTDSLFFNLKNLLDSSAFYIVCNGHPKPMPDIEKFENNAWHIEWSPVCNGFSTYCCKEFIKTGTINDTITLVGLEKGTHRLKFTFSVYNSHNQFVNYESMSKNFTIE